MDIVICIPNLFFIQYITNGTGQYAHPDRLGNEPADAEGGEFFQILFFLKS